jgi:hypothetical protein
VIWEAAVECLCTEREKVVEEGRFNELATLSKRRLGYGALIGITEAIE